MNTRSGRENLTSYTLVDILKKEADLVNVLYKLIAEQHLTSQRRKKVKDHQDKLNQLWDEFDANELTADEFLDKCSSLAPF